MIIYRANGTAVHEIESFNIGSKLSKKLMGDDYVIIPFTSESPIDFQLGDYIDVFVKDGNVRYELTKKYIPTYDTNTATYKYDLRLDAYYMKWANKIVKYDPQSGGTELSFALTSSIGTHTSIILANLAALSYTYWATNIDFVVAFDESVDQTAAKLVQYDNISILDAITSIAKTFECEWWVTDNVIHFGKCQAPDNVSEVVFTLGDNISDMSKSDNGTDLITKLYVFGSDRNLPRNYKKNENAEIVRAAVVQRRLMLPTASELSNENAEALTSRGYTLNADGSITIVGSDVTERFVEGVLVNDDVYPKADCVVSEVTTYESSVTEEDESVTTETYYRLVDGSGLAFTNDMILEGQTLHIIFTSGSLNGMDFECEHNEAGGYYEVVANENYGRKLPDVNLHPSVGDKFVLYNWDSSQLENTGLIPAASNKLLEEVIKYLDKAKIDPNDYTCTEDCIESDYTIRELGDKVRLVNPAYFSGGRSSRIVGIEINLDLPYDHPRYICGEKADYVYQGKVSSTEELTFNGQSYQGKSSGGGSSIYLIRLNDMTRPSDSNTYSAKRIMNDFLSSIDEDTAQGFIQFLAGLSTGNFSHGYSGAQIDAEGKAELDAATIRRYLQSSNFVKGQLGGEGWGIYKNVSGYSTMEIDNLIVRMKAIFAELEIRKLSYLGGDYIFSAAGSKICKVEYIGLDENDQEIVLAATKLIPLVDSNGAFITQDGQMVVWEKEEDIDPEDITAFRCYVYSDDGTTATMNWWQVGDQARCQTFNVKERGTTNNAANRYYWRLVTGVGSAVLEDGRSYNYVDLSVNDCSLHDDENLEDDWPEPNDAIVQLGSRVSGSRQNAIEIVVEGDDAPAIIEYAGIGNYDLASHRRTKLSPKGDEFVAKSFRYMTSQESYVRIPVDRGAWDEDETYYNYDRVSHNGTLWLCIIPDDYDQSGERIGITGDDYEPQTPSDYWLAQVTGGQQGPAGQSAPTMVCSPNPVMVYTDKNKLALSAWNTTIAVMVYYNGVRTSIVSWGTVSTDGTWTIGTKTIDANGIGYIPLSGASGAAVQNGTVSIVANIANPNESGTIAVNGNVTVSPTMRGDDGGDASLVIKNPDTEYIPTDQYGKPKTNYEGTVYFYVADPNGNLAQVFDGILFDGQSEYAVTKNSVKVVQIGYDEVGYDSTGNYIAAFVNWRQSETVTSLDLPIQIKFKYSQSDSEWSYINTFLSIRALRQGSDGDSSLSLQYSPNAVWFKVNSSLEAVDYEELSVEVRAFWGTERIADIDAIANLHCTDENIDDDITSQILSETIGGQTYEYAVITAKIWEDYTYSTDNIYVSFDLQEGDNGFTIPGGFPIIRSVSGADGNNGTNGRGISSISVTYGVSDSAVDPPTSWSNNVQPTDQGEYLWSKTIMNYTDGTSSDPIYQVMYQASDGADGTSVSIKGTAVGHARNISTAIAAGENGIWLIDENGSNPSVTAVINVSGSSYTTIAEYGNQSKPLASGDGYIVESTGHLWVATQGAWIDAGRIKGDDGKPSYIHYAWANSADGSLNFTTTKTQDQEFVYMGVCADNTPEDPGSASRPVENAWTLYEWNPIKGADGTKGTTVIGDAIAYIDDTNAGTFAFTDNGVYLADLNNYSLNSSGNLVSVTAGTGMGHKTITKSASGKSAEDVDEGDAYLIDGILYSSVDFHWVNLGRFNGENAYIHYAWGDEVERNPLTGAVTYVKGFTTTKLATEDKRYIGIYVDNEEDDIGNGWDSTLNNGQGGYPSGITGDPNPWEAYEWNLLKGNGIKGWSVSYKISQNGVDPPTEGTWWSTIELAIAETGQEVIPPLHYLWTKTVLTFDTGSQTSYAVAYSGSEGRDGRSVVILGTWPTVSSLPYPVNGKIPLAPGGEATHDLEISEGFVVEEDGHLYVWLGDDSGWKDVGKFNGDDGRTSYLHIAWANKIVYDQYGMVSKVNDFTIEKPEGVDYYYMGVCTNFDVEDPDVSPGTQPTDQSYLDVVSLYTWNMIKGAEGSNGTTILDTINLHTDKLSSSMTVSGWYAVDNPASYPSSGTYHITNATPCLRRRYNNGWPTGIIDKYSANPASNKGLYYPNEGESFLDQDGVLWSYIEAKWVNLGKYIGDNAYLHLAWANTLNDQGVPYPAAEHGFTTQKTTTQDYPYVGFCSDNNLADPDDPRVYTWQRLRGMSQPIIDTGTDQVIADADNDGKISSISDVSGLPTTVRLMVEDSAIGMGSWIIASCYFTMVYSDGSTARIPLQGTWPSQKAGVKLKQFSFGSNLQVEWEYVQQSGVGHIALPLRQIKIHIEASHQDNNFVVTKTIPFIVNRAGKGTQFRVQYCADKNGTTEPWHYGYNDSTTHTASATDKWMRISDDGGAHWGEPIKIVASDMNVKGEAYFHWASIQSKPSGFADNKIGLVDVIGSSYAVIVYWTGSTRHDVVAAQGECYILRDENSDADGHLFIAAENGWHDLGQIAGADGQNGVVATLNPANLILTQKDDGTLDSFSTKVVIIDGNTLVPINDRTTSNWSFTNLVNTINPLPIGDTITLQADTHSVTETYDDGTTETFYNVPYDHGSVDINFTYKGMNWTLRFNWYANLLGTWKQTIKGDVNTMIANKVTYQYGSDGEVYFTDNNGFFILSATKAQSLLEEYTKDEGGFDIVNSSLLEQMATSLRAELSNSINGVNTSITTIEATSDQIISTVSNLKVEAENLFSFAGTHLTNGSYGVSGIVPFIQGYGVECKAVSNRITGFGLQGQGGNFVITCEMRMQAYDGTVSIDFMDINPQDGGNFNLNTSWAKKTWVFKNVPDASTLTNNLDGYLDIVCDEITNSNRLYVRNLMISRGDCKPSGFNISSKDMGNNLPGDIVSFTKHENVQLQSEKYKGYSVYKLHFENGVTAMTDMLFANDVYLKQNQCYSLSFWARSTNDCHIACFMHGSGDTVDGSITPTLIVAPSPTLKSGEMSVGNAVDGVTYIRLTTSYNRYTVYWWSSSANARSIVLGRVQSSFTTVISADIYITGVEFREGYWTSDKLNSQSMIRQTATEIEMKVNETGINIEDGTITLNADNTTIIGDLSLHDANQGLVLYDENRIARVAIKSDELGNIGDYDFGSRLIAENDAISINGTVTFDTFELGTVSNGDVINIPYIAVSTNIGTEQSSLRYSYDVRINNQKIGGSVTGTASGQGKFILDSVTRTANSSGALTLVLTLTNVRGNTSFHAVVIVGTTATGLNKIGKDGAVFAKDSTHYNWFGKDKTVLRQGSAVLELSDGNGLKFNDWNIGRTPVWVITASKVISGSDIHFYDEFLYVTGTGWMEISLPNPSGLAGKKYYIKSLRNLTVRCNGHIIKQNSTGKEDYDEINNRSTIFISTGDAWVEFYCG